MKKIICFHLYNDYSGSPAVLSLVITGLLRKYTIDLYTSKGGVLSSISDKNLKHYYNFYTFTNNKTITFLSYLIIQIYWFFICFKYLFSKNIFYINTILPAGPAIFAFLMRKKLIYHCHENPDAKGLLYKILAFVMKKIANRIICVSNDQLRKLNTKKGIVVYNAVPDSFAKQANTFYPEYSLHPKILMISSLKKYKGIYEFIDLADNFTNYSFELVLNADEQEVDLLRKNYNSLRNLKIHSRQKNIIPFYKDTNLLLNLSIPELFVETFGMTVIEAMFFGVPTIVPTIGGITELVIDGYNGFRVHPLDKNNLKSKIEIIFESEETYNEFVLNAKSECSKYSSQTMIAEINSILTHI
jgi:glycosyltransferase involved in cell wall biosynthesis